MLREDVKSDTIEYQKMLAEAFDLIQKLSDEQLQKIMEALKCKFGRSVKKKASSMKSAWNVTIWITRPQ